MTFDEASKTITQSNSECAIKTEGGMTGGADAKTYIKICIYVIIAATSAYLVSTADQTIKNAVIVGVAQVLKGQCGTVTNQFWGWLGLNPICGMYNKIFTIITRAMIGDPTSWATIIGAVTATGTAGRLTITNIDNLAGAIAGVIAPGGNLIEDAKMEDATEMQGITDRIKETTTLALTNGGKRSKTNKRKHNKAKKSKKSRKSARKSKSRK